MRAYCSRFLALWLFALLGTLAVSPTSAGEIVLELEEPTANSTYTGVANIRGWVVGSVGIDRVELYVNGELKTNIPIGGRRSDVGAEYPNFPDSSDSGFSMAFPYSGLTAGQHTILVRAVDREGAFQDASATFNVTRFDNPYISDPARVSLEGATGGFDSRSIFINNMTADGKTYDIRLDWRTAIQGYAITQIIPTGGGQIQDFSGTYEYTGSLVSNDCPASPPTESQSVLQINQAGVQLSGTVGNLPISGSVDGSGNFSLTSATVEENVPDVPGCKILARGVYEGNFLGQTVTESINVRDVAGTCPLSFDCVIRYEGTIQQAGSAGTANLDAKDSKPGSPVEAILRDFSIGLQ